MRRIMRQIAVLTTMCIAALIVSIPHATAAGTARASYAPHLDRKIVATRASNLGPQIATWYGPGFFGHRTACGGTLTRSTWGIAHRTLPCGTLVTLAHNGRTISVRVIDRGPFSGATVDLTARTKEYLHFVSGNVRLVRIKTFRMLPRPKPVAGLYAIRG